MLNKNMWITFINKTIEADNKNWHFEFIDS